MNPLNHIKAPAKVKTTSAPAFTEPPKGIIITFSRQMLKEFGLKRLKNWDKIKVTREDRINLKSVNYVALGYRQVREEIKALKHNQWWSATLSNLPTHDILFCFISICGEIRYKAKILGFDKAKEKHFTDGRSMTAKNWVMLNEFVELPESDRIKLNGFQGFRYVKPGSALEKLI